MTLARNHPHFPKADLERLRKLYLEVEGLRAEGRWDRMAFDRLWPQFLEAVGDEGDELEPLLVNSPRDWYSEYLRVERGPELEDL
ncbi:hypothetical protein [Meiothermus rufus]|uniref:hypothetical protein n=1 Tax=Meiothermus rufus TaxID=604332 RepID=UPI0004145D09|nr:hypothetical protein [Meiothermus rufus]